MSSVASACGRCTAAHYTVLWSLCHWLDWWKHSLCWSVCTVQEMEDEFLYAALTGDLLEVKRLIAKGCSASSKNEVKSTHLSVYIHTLSSSMFPYCRTVTVQYSN